MRPIDRDVSLHCGSTRMEDIPSALWGLVVVLAEIAERFAWHEEQHREPPCGPNEGQANAASEIEAPAPLGSG